MNPARWIYTLPLRLRSIFRPACVERDLADEFEYHVEMKTGEYIASGMAADKARQSALRAMGGLEQQKEICRDARRLRWLIEFFRDLRYGARILARDPGFAVVAILMLALGIGANTAVIAVYEMAIFQPLPFADIDRLVEISPGFNYPNYIDIRTDEKAFSDIAIWMGLPQSARDSSGRNLAGRAVSANFFRVVGLPMTLGRGFLPEEDRLSDSPAVAVISYQLWQTVYAADPAIVGKTIQLNDELLTIVGVAPKALKGDLGVGPVFWDYWVPFPMFARITQLEKAPMWREGIESRSMGPWLSSYGRLKPGFSIEQAKAQMAVLFSNLQKTYPESIRDEAKPILVPASRARWPSGTMLFSGIILMSATLCILLITCTNIAGLLLARGSARRHEIATRLAVGAGRGRIIRQLLAEGFALSAIALILSLGAYGLTLHLMSVFGIPPDFTHTNLDFAFSYKTLLFASGISLLATLMFGLTPALAATRIELGGALKDQNVRAGFGKSRGRRILTVAQIAATVVLLAGAGILGRTVMHFVSMDPGLDRNVLIIPADSTYAIDKSRRMNFYSESLERVRNIPGVRSAAWGLVPPFETRSYIMERVRPEKLGYGNDTWFNIQANAVSPGYFRTLGIPMLQGRDFTDIGAGSAGEVIINETMARRFWPGRSPLGEQIRIRKADPGEHRQQGAELCEVIGVVKDVTYKTPWDEKIAYIYFPYRHWFYMGMDLHVSIIGNPYSVIPEILKTCRSADSRDFLAADASLVSAKLEALLSEERSAAYILGIFGALALVLATIGLYGIIAYSVARRTREFGIRASLGASGRDIIRQVILEGLKMAATGLAIGLLCSAALSRFLVSRMHGLSPMDLSTYAAISALVIAIAALASFLPARRAAGSPMDALRGE